MFLEDFEDAPRVLKFNFGESKESHEALLHLSGDSGGLEVVVFEFQEELNKQKARKNIHEAYKKRKGRRPAPVLVVFSSPEDVLVCGASGTEPPVFHTKDKTQVKRLCKRALGISEKNEAIRYLSRGMPLLEEELPGIANVGLLSTHELSHGVQRREDWNQASQKARPLTDKTGKDLLTGLGYKSEKLDNMTALLTAGQKETALAVLLHKNEIPEAGSERFNNASPISYALTKADQKNLPWVVMLQNEYIRLYSTRNIGVGRRGRTETYVECNLPLLSEKSEGLLWLLFSAQALQDNGTTKEILENSRRYAEDVATRLRERIYDTVVPRLAMGIAQARKLDAVTAAPPPPRGF